MNFQEATGSKLGEGTKQVFSEFQIAEKNRVCLPLQNQHSRETICTWKKVAHTLKAISVQRPSLRAVVFYRRSHKYKKINTMTDFHSGAQQTKPNNDANSQLILKVTAGLTGWGNNS